MTREETLDKFFCIKTIHVNSDGSIGTVMSKPGSTYQLAKKATICGTIYVGDDVVIESARIEPKVVIYDHATIRENVFIGQGAIIYQGAVIDYASIIGRHCCIGQDCRIGHLTVVGDKIIIKKESVIPSMKIVYADKNNTVRMKQRVLD